MIRRPRAPISVLVARVTAGTGVISLYVVLRLPQLTSPWEAVVTWFGAVLCLWASLTAAEQLVTRQRDRLAPGEPSVLELTDVIPPLREWPGEIELAIAEARHEATHAIVDRGLLGEYLFTHDVLCEPTPPRGVLIPVEHDSLTDWAHSVGAREYAPYYPEQIADDPTALQRFIREETYTGRHRLADAQLHRDRSGQFFGTL